MSINEYQNNLNTALAQYSQQSFERLMGMQNQRLAYSEVRGQALRQENEEQNPVILLLEDVQ